MNTTREDISWRRLAIGSFALLVFVALAWNGVAFVIDSSPLRQSTDSWGMTFGSVLCTVIYGSVPLAVSLGLAMVAALASPASARLCAWGVAGLAAVCAAGLAAGAAVLWTGPPAEVAFGMVTAVLALLLLVPSLFCLRRGSAERHRA